LRQRSFGVSEEKNMALNLSNLGAPKGANSNKKRVGRGMGSGMGKTSTRGHDGQRARSGSRMMRGFEGGQMPLHRRLPKRGFTNIFRQEYQVLSLDTIELIASTKSVTEFTLEALKEQGLLKKRKALVKVLANGEINTAVTVYAHKFSKTAQDKIEKAGGKAIVLGGAPVEAAA
jgi:large subunit ribosomal protein L15